MLPGEIKNKGLFDRRLQLATWTVILSIVVIYFLNGILPMINLDTDRWEYPSILPFIHPVGTDFREGLFYPAKVLLQGKSPYTDYNQHYPPLTNLIGIPFRLFQVQTAYIIQVILIFVLNVVTVFIAVKIFELVFPGFPNVNSNSTKLLSILLFVSVSFYTLTSYGFIFSVERGNYDIYTMFFSVLGLWLLIKHPEKLWWQVILFSIATHLKVYPAILFALVLWKHRWKALLPIILTNLVLLFIIGYDNAILFIKVVIKFFGSPYIYIGNQSGMAFGTLLNRSLTSHFGFILPSWLFTIIPIILWSLGFVVLLWRKYTPYHAVLLFVLSVPVMCLVPSTSFDYKLVILSAPVLIFLGFIFQSYISQGKIADIILLIVTIVVMFMLGRSPALIHGLIASKYPFILLFQFVTLVMILLPVRQPSGSTAIQRSQLALG